MLLAIDVGNTSVHFGLFADGGNTPLRQWRVSTARISAQQNISLRRSEKQKIRITVVASVVPRANKILKKIFPQAIFVDYRNIGIRVMLKKPAEVGADRLVNARAVKELYGGPAIIVDFGTATTFDVINAKGDYLGGAIAPGILLARDTLHERTAKLPSIEIKAPHSVIGKSTVEAMQSGLVYGYAAMVEGMIKRLKTRDSRLGTPLVIATGGLARLICKQTTVVDRIDSELTLKGLKFIGYERRT